MSSDTEPAERTWTAPSTGTPCWISIPAKDVARAKTFYHDVFGWKFRDSPDPVSYPPSNFALFTTPTPIIMGGIIKVDNNPAQKSADGVVMYLLVDDIEATFEKVKTAGGSVVEGKVADGNHTLRGKIADTEGNVVGILKWLAC
jgi:predicted enzyme related to lactoylglutathione lyase